MGYFRWTYHEAIVRFKIRRVPIEHSSGALLEAPVLSSSTPMYTKCLRVTRADFPDFFLERTNGESPYAKRKTRSGWKLKFLDEMTLRHLCYEARLPRKYAAISFRF